MMRCNRDCKSLMVDKGSVRLCSCATFFYIIVVVSNVFSQNTHLSLIFGSTLEIFLFLRVDYPMNFLSFLFNDSVLCQFQNTNTYSTFVNLNSCIFVLHVLNTHEMYDFKLCRRWSVTYVPSTL